MYEPFVLECVSRPQFLFLQRGYDDYRGNSLPCRRGVTNQCAVRMSIALGRSGFGLETFKPHNRVHDGGAHCGTNGMEHVLGAEELAKFLRHELFEPTVYRPPRGEKGCAHVYDEIRDARGILYFNNCFTRAGETTAKGDHIDLFDGKKYYNQILHPKAGGDETTGGDLFGRADHVWFWRLM